MKYEITTAPTSLPITYQQASAHLRLDQTTDLAYVNDCIADAVDFAQEQMECSIMTQTITATFWEYKSKLPLPRGPVQAINSITANGVTVDPSAYTLQCNGNSDYVYIPSNVALPIVVEYDAGYTLLPRDIRRAILNHVATMYTYRESVATIQVHDMELALMAIYQTHKRTSMVG